MKSHWLRGLIFVLAVWVIIVLAALAIPRSIYADYLDPIGILIGIILAIPVFWTAYHVTWGEEAQRRRFFKQISKKPGRTPSILVVNLLPGKDMRNQVENFRQQHEVLKDIPQERIITIRRDAPLQPKDVSELQNELKKAAAALMDSGTDCIHIFLAGPLVAAAMVGAEFANMPANVYQYQGGEYVNYGVLRLHSL